MLTRALVRYSRHFAAMSDGELVAMLRGRLVPIASVATPTRR